MHSFIDFVLENQPNFSVIWIIDNYYHRHQCSSNIKVVGVFFFGWAANSQRSARMPWGPPDRKWHTWWMQWTEVMLTRAPCMQKIPFLSHLWILITSAPDVSTTVKDIPESRLLIVVYGQVFKYFYVLSVCIAVPGEKMHFRNVSNSEVVFLHEDI